jgi:hypothetical protein
MDPEAIRMNPSFPLSSPILAAALHGTDFIAHNAGESGLVDQASRAVDAPQAVGPVW